MNAIRLRCISKWGSASARVTNHKTSLKRILRIGERSNKKHDHLAGFFAGSFAGFGLTFGMGFADQTRFNASLKGIAGA